MSILEQIAQGENAGLEFKENRPADSLKFTVAERHDEPSESKEKTPESKEEMPESKEKTPESKEKPPESKEEICSLLAANPTWTANDLAKKLSLSRSGIEKNLRLLKKCGMLMRKGSTKNGKWIVLERKS